MKEKGCKEKPMKTYLERINEQTPTRMWVNNPTPSEAKKGLEAGTFGATSNPTYLSHMSVGL